MIIYYPTYYLVPVSPVMFSYEDEYNDNHDSRYDIETSEIYNTYRTISEDLFYEVDEEYVNDNIK
ncbi:hypothetical protein [Clostridium estertheticum]|uniref:hypothetical protein n=1 Tax=Clostridium estertheticum TaxID=238834 RepID=UPI001C6EA155|nr:hypothetical protein [Clostridium estertheticum]MBW9153145.1 hypothetical protein [Clostridium estertheticum]WLC83688.1 hypothetical protein KTC97_16745 [Clostridium estertheticum]